MPSKKQSAAKPLEPVFFIDRSLGVEPLRSTLVRAGVLVEIHDDHFKRDEQDHVWLAEVSARSWVVLTKDKRLRYRPLEISVLRESGARVRLAHLSLRKPSLSRPPQSYSPPSWQKRGDHVPGGHSFWSAGRYPAIECCGLGTSPRYRCNPCD